jgi:hypothetical protein
MSQPNEPIEAAQVVSQVPGREDGRDFLEGAGIVGGYRALRTFHLWQQFKPVYPNGTYGEYLLWKQQQQRIYRRSPRRNLPLAVIAGLLGVMFLGVNRMTSNGWLIPVWLVLLPLPGAHRGTGNDDTGAV